MSADAFAEILLHLRYERVFGWQIETVEGVIGRLETSGQGTGVESLRRGDFLICDFGGPEGVDCEGLRDSEWRQVRVGPGDCVVAVELAVIAVPGRGAVVGLRIVVVAVAVPAQVEELVRGVRRGVAVELGELVVEALPLGAVAVGTEGGVGGVGAVDEAEVCGFEIEGGGVGCGLILLEIACDGGVVDVWGWGLGV